MLSGNSPLLGSIPKIMMTNINCPECGKLNQNFDPAKLQTCWNCGEELQYATPINCKVCGKAMVENDDCIVEVETTFPEDGDTDYLFDDDWEVKAYRHKHCA